MRHQEEEKIDTSSKQIPLDPEIERLKKVYKSIVLFENQNEDNWRCDVCLQETFEDNNPLYICDLCMVVVHLSCYNRDLLDEYEKDKDEPWFCSRCKHLIEDKTPVDLIPHCHLCPEIKGAIIDVQDGIWVHIQCVNWHNDIWFDPEDEK